jgi:hypothetical protein
MSAGYYNHAFKTIARLAVDIGYELSEDFKQTLYTYRDDVQIEIIKDSLDPRLKKHRKIIKQEIDSLVEDLKSIADRSEALELFLDKKITSDEYIDIINRPLE